MAGKDAPGPTCQSRKPIQVRDGTMCRTSTPPPGPIRCGSFVATFEPSPTRQATVQLPERATQSLSISLGAETSWDSVVREVYNRGALAIRQQAQEFVRTGQMTVEQAKVWSNGQRNALMQACRDKSSPLGRAIAEALKPQPKSVADLEKLGKSAAGIIESAGKTNPYVNRIAVGFRYAGPTLLIIGLVFSAYHIASAPGSERWHVVTQEGGTWTGALAGGWAGGEIGLETGAAIGSIFPGAGTAIGGGIGVTVGAIGGAIYFGMIGSAAGDFVYRSLEKL